MLDNHVWDVSYRVTQLQKLSVIKKIILRALRISEKENKL